MEGKYQWRTATDYYQSYTTLWSVLWPETERWQSFSCIPKLSSQHNTSLTHVTNRPVYEMELMWSTTENREEHKVTSDKSMVVLPMILTLTMRRNMVKLVNIRIFYHMLAECEPTLADFQVCPGKDLIEECIACKTVQKDKWGRCIASE